MMAARQLKHVKIWVDDRRGTYPKMTPEVYNAVIDEAHAHRMLVHAHAIAMEDQKAVVRAGADVLVHTVANEKLDDELIALLQEKKPYWTTVIGLGDRSEACNSDPFIDQSYPAPALAAIRAERLRRRRRPTPRTAKRCSPTTCRRWWRPARRLVLGTDAGITARHAFGWADHHEIARWVELGLTPAQAIAAATARPAELLGINDLGTLAVGKSADFIVLDANPLENIRNTRQIASVYLRGARLNRDALASAFKNAGAGDEHAPPIPDHRAARRARRRGRLRERAAEHGRLRRRRPPARRRHSAPARSRARGVAGHLRRSGKARAGDDERRAEREMAAASWQRSMAPLLERRAGPRKVALEPQVAPATQWNPASVAASAGPARDLFVRSTSDGGAAAVGRRRHRLRARHPALALDRTEGAHLRAADEHLPSSASSSSIRSCAA